MVLNTEVTPELEAEGLARDMVRAIQQARKDAGLNVSDRISTLTAKQDVVEALLANAELVKTETLTVELETLAADVKDPQVSVAEKVGSLSHDRRILRRKRLRRAAGRAPENKMEPRLAPLHRAMEILGEPNKAFPMIHVTGTNGKTSTARMIEAGLRAHGLSTGRSRARTCPRSPSGSASTAPRCRMTRSSGSGTRSGRTCRSWTANSRRRASPG